MTEPKMQAREDRADELILMMADTMPPQWQETAWMGNMCYWTDRVAMRRLGRPISGAKHHLLPGGPAPGDLADRLLRLQRRGAIRLGGRHTVTRCRQVAQPRVIADYDAFDQEELECVKEAYERYGYLSEEQRMRADQLTGGPPQGHLYRQVEVTADLMGPTTEPIAKEREPALSAA